MKSLALLPLLATLASAQVPNLLVNGGFELGPGASTVTTMYSPSSELTGWFIFTGSVDQVREWVTLEGSYCVDLDGFTPGGIQQTVATVPGMFYELNFLLAGNPDTGDVKTLQVTAGDTTSIFTFDSAGHDHGHLGWTRTTVFFTALSSSTTIQFLSLDDAQSGRGPALDDVVLHELDSGYSSAFGSGCGGSFGTPGLVPNQNPRIGQPFSALLTNLTPNQPAFGLLGFDFYYPNPFFDLTTLGMPGCSLYVLPEVLDYTPDTGPFGAFVWGKVLPDDPSLANLRFTVQFLVGDPAANSVGMAATNAIRCVIGR